MTSTQKSHRNARGNATPQALIENAVKVQPLTPGRPLSLSVCGKTALKINSTPLPGRASVAPSRARSCLVQLFLVTIFFQRKALEDRQGSSTLVKRRQGWSSGFPKNLALLWRLDAVPSSFYHPCLSVFIRGSKQENPADFRPSRTNFYERRTINKPPGNALASIVYRKS
jgi:hypothetical protein